MGPSVRRDAPEGTTMNRAFTPSFQNLQKDIERYLKSEGRSETNEHGQTVFRGYDAALAGLFREYMDKGAFVPLVAEFRSWNWEWGYNDFLLELTASLRKARNWQLLKDLWAGVIASGEPITTRRRKLREPDRTVFLKSWSQRQERSFWNHFTNFRATPPSFNRNPMRVSMWR
jgi:hypothetical protein